MKQFSKLLFNIFMILLFIVSLDIATASKEKDVFKNIPDVVIEAFKSTYPNAVIKEAEIEEDDDSIFYEIESIDGSTKRDIFYNADGSIIEIEETIDVKNLPELLKQVINTNYPKAKIKEVEKIIKDDEVKYEICIKSGFLGLKRTEIIIDENGKLYKDEED